MLCLRRALRPTRHIDPQVGGVVGGHPYDAGMPDALPIPDDLIALQRALDAARAELGAWIAETEAARRLEYPAPEQILERGIWPDDLRARLADLRAVRAAASTAVWHHPTIVQALEDRCHWATDEALKDAARRADPADV